MLHCPSDSPGFFTQRYASASATPVVAVGLVPFPEPGGLHQLPFWSAVITDAGWLYGAAAYADMSFGPRPLRLVSTMKCAVGTAPLSMEAKRSLMAPT